MKKIILVLSGVLFAFVVNAQDNKTTDPATKPAEAKPATQAQPAVQSQPRTHDMIMMKEGKMWVMKDGKTTPMEKEMDMPNGNKVMTDGTVMMKDGSKMAMKDGDRMNMNGDMVKSPPKKMEEKKMEEKKADPDKK